MKLKFNRYIVNREEDVTEDSDGKKFPNPMVKANISLIADVIGKKNTAELVLTVEVFSFNSDTGDQMDAQRKEECIEFINKF